jgi:hypothetical protein
MKNILMALTVLILAPVAKAQFMASPSGPVENVFPNTNTCSSQSMIDSVDSRLILPKAAQFITKSWGISALSQEVLWKIQVSARASDALVMQWHIVHSSGIDLTDDEKNATYLSGCGEGSCYKNLGNAETVGDYSPCRLSGGFFLDGHEEDGYYQLAVSGKIVRAHRKIAIYGGPLSCAGQADQDGQRVDTVIYTEDVPNYVGLSVCSPTILVREWIFANDKGEIQHTLHNEMVDADLSVK